MLTFRPPGVHTVVTAMTSTENSIAGLMAEAAEWTRRGQNANAVSLWQRVLRLDPGHAPSLNYLGAYALAQGNASEAALYLNRAIESDPGLAIAHANLSRLHLQRGDTARALEAITSAIHAEPTAWGAHFEKARLLESAGRIREAATAWDNGLQYMPEAAKNSPQLQQLVQQAKAAVAESREQLAEFLSQRLHGLREGRTHRELERFNHSLDIISGRRSFVTARPLMLPVPRLPAIPFFHREDFDWAPRVEAAFPSILEELNGLLATDAGFEPYIQTAAGEPMGQFAALDRKPDWGAYFLWKNGERIDAHADRCPRTEAAVALAPQITVPKRAPVIFFSALKPGTTIPPHNGATNARLTVHLPLIIPGDCGLRVGEETHVWKPGKLVIFDDTIRHEAWNHSKQLRVVLIFDVWHPMLTPLEREMVAHTIEGMMAFYGENADLGEL
ncbi:aspartyl beta-hydroxylase [Pseudoxanthomonas sacheonensis]|nr:aspartyl beta-hydroxylase [Pseudoxanthomonas sacheonensis]